MTKKKEERGKRGRDFESLIDRTNEAYLFNDLAVVNKIPTDWVIVRDYRDMRKIKSAFPRQKSTVDYIGLALGLPIAFEAKSSKNKKFFPIANIKEHQITFLNKWEQLKGIAFYLIHFSSYERTFLMYARQLKEDFLDKGLKNIPCSYFGENCKEVFSQATMPIDYIKALKEHL